MRPADGQWQSRPVHVELVQIRANGLEPSERHWREGLVDLVEIDVLNREAGGFERAPDSVDRLLQHDDRVTRGDSQADDACDRPDLMVFQSLLADDQRGGGAIAALACISSGITPSSFRRFTDPIDSSDALKRIPSSPMS
jgi:hypothetical protein